MVNVEYRFRWGSVTVKTEGLNYCMNVSEWSLLCKLREAMPNAIRYELGAVMQLI